MKKNENGQAISVADSDGLTGQLLMMGLWTLVGCLLPQSVLYGTLSPFGVGLAAAVCGPSSVPVYLAVVAGYVLPHGIAFPIRYLVAVAGTAGLRWALGAFPRVSEHLLFAPLSAFVCLLSGGLALIGFVYTDAYGIFLLVIEAVMAGAFAWAAATAYRIKAAEFLSLQAAQKSALLWVLAATLLSLSSFRVSGIAPGRVLCIIFILLSARLWYEKGGATAGIAVGALLTVSGEHPLFLGVAYALGGLVAGAMSKRSRLAVCASFFVIALLPLPASADRIDAMIQVYEAAAAVLLFLIVPPSWEQRLRRWLCVTEDSPAANGVRISVSSRLSQTAAAMREVAGTVDAVSQKMATLGAPSIGSMYRQSCDEVCRRCRLRMQCWEENFSDTMDSLNAVTPQLREKGRIEAGQIGGRLSGCCPCLERLAAGINAGYREHLVRENAFRRLADLRTAVTDQFSGMADILKDMSQAVSQEKNADERTAFHVAQLCRDYGLRRVTVGCELDRQQRMTLYICADDRQADWEEKDFLQDLHITCGRRFAPPSVTRSDRYQVHMRLEEMPRFEIQIAKTQLSCRGERYCGDAIEQFTRSDGEVAVVLSDGMGSGGRAAVDGAMAAGLTAKLMQSGLEADSVLRLVNSALMAKGADESLATLDIAQIDPHTGRLTCCKAGAALSFLKSAQGICHIERASLPIGILRNIVFEKSCFSLAEGDLLLMVSDGAVGIDNGWIERLLTDFNAGDQALQELVNTVARTARQRQKQDHEDDVSVIAVQLRSLNKFV